MFFHITFRLSFDTRETSAADNNSITEAGLEEAAIVWTSVGRCGPARWTPTLVCRGGLHCFLFACPCSWGLWSPSPLVFLFQFITTLFCWHRIALHAPTPSLIVGSATSLFFPTQGTSLILSFCPVPSPFQSPLTHIVGRHRQDSRGPLLPLRRFNYQGEGKGDDGSDG